MPAVVPATSPPAVLELVAMELPVRLLRQVAQQIGAVVEVEAGAITQP